MPESFNTKYNPPSVCNWFSVSSCKSHVIVDFYFQRVDGSKPLDEHEPEDMPLVHISSIYFEPDDFRNFASHIRLLDAQIEKDKHR